MPKCAQVHGVPTSRIANVKHGPESCLVEAVTLPRWHQIVHYKRRLRHNPRFEAFLMTLRHGSPTAMSFYADLTGSRRRLDSNNIVAAPVLRAHDPYRRLHTFPSARSPLEPPHMLACRTRSLARRVLRRNVPFNTDETRQTREFRSRTILSSPVRALGLEYSVASGSHILTHNTIHLPLLT